MRKSKTTFIRNPKTGKVTQIIQSGYKIKDNDTDQVLKKKVSAFQKKTKLAKRKKRASYITKVKKSARRTQKILRTIPDPMDLLILKKGGK